MKKLKSCLFICFIGVLVIVAVYAHRYDRISNKIGNELVKSNQNSSDEQKIETGKLDDSEPIRMDNFWEMIYVDSSNKLLFATGLEIIVPKDWDNQFVIATDMGFSSNTLIISEKTNAEAIDAGDLFYLSFILYEEGVIREIFGVDKVLGLYEQGAEKYVLILEKPRDMCYVEGNEKMKEAYEKLSLSVDDVQIKVDSINGFTICGIDDLEWVQQYE